MSFQSAAVQAGLAKVFLRVGIITKVDGTEKKEGLQDFLECPISDYRDRNNAQENLTLRSYIHAKFQPQKLVEVYKSVNFRLLTFGISYANGLYAPSLKLNGTEELNQTLTIREGIELMKAVNGYFTAEHRRFRPLEETLARQKNAG